MGPVHWFPDPSMFSMTKKKICLKGEREKQNVALDLDVRLGTVWTVMLMRMNRMLWPSAISWGCVPLSFLGTKVLSSLICPIVGVA